MSTTSGCWGPRCVRAGRGARSGLTHGQPTLAGAPLQANPRQSFWAWVHKHEKAYKHDLVQFEARFRNWLDNLEYVLDYNSKHTSHWVGGDLPTWGLGAQAPGSPPSGAPRAAAWRIRERREPGPAAPESGFTGCAGRPRPLSLLFRHAGAGIWVHAWPSIPAPPHPPPSPLQPTCSWA
jgi:hypothetical protein